MDYFPGSEKSITPPQTSTTVTLSTIGSYTTSNNTPLLVLPPLYVPYVLTMGLVDFNVPTTSVTNTYYIDKGTTPPIFWIFTKVLL